MDSSGSSRGKRRATVSLRSSPRLSRGRRSRMVYNFVSSSGESSSNSEAKRARPRPKSPSKKKRKKKTKPEPEYEVIYADPSDALRSPPPRRTRPRRKGDTIGDALVFGDCLTWGMSHQYFGRDMNCHWPSHLRDRLLSIGYRLVESSMISRTTAYNDIEGGDFKSMGACDQDLNGKFHFGTVFSSHSPNWVIIMLGTHDLKVRIRNIASQQKPLSLNFMKEEENSEGESSSESEEDKSYPVTADRIAENCAYLGLKARQMFEGHCHEGRLNIVLVAPPRIRLTEISRKFGFDEESVAISKELPKAFEKVCRKYNFLFAYRKLSMSSSVDGIHLTAKGSRKLADTIWEAMSPALPRATRKPERFKPVQLSK
mmetsp:Transcript_4766/g.5890  ORF Transcript_4766/g.5890 Transcript_4766/m.5890 type:complete len:371 (-) Transcript_4766:191-1303(-)|eukprot:CAMPEP_0184041060 /NCGR_PEP_ID=MMETSP0955-20130417/60587_1 /TAXON_ID=627963 /ORGANISM="Aplanochytrium sp, Strain PBS07" /LENGTH=370 /DNA_ID=CAMNT_0026331147 /DNA_START=116 /DNA_END=1228 /DNA_ORIENTATION=+